MLEIQGLKVKVEEKTVLCDLDLTVPDGSVHAMMGPNGSGKTTLSQTVMGNPHCHVVEGSMRYGGKDLLQLSTYQRARLGLFMAFQHPVEIPGLMIGNFLFEAYNAQRKAHKKDLVDRLQFTKRLKAKAELLHIDSSMLLRPLNVGYSGGEKKRFEILQLLVLEPRFVILDELDSGLDVDSLRLIVSVLKTYFRESTERSALLITHYDRFLEDFAPDRVHILGKKRLQATGGIELARKIGREGFVS